MKPKNGSVGKDKSETMMNLLDSTDSDVEWLSLPPIKGKKPKKKKPMKVINNNDNSCSMWCFLKGFLIFCVIAAICLLSIVVTWMSGEMSDLREKLKSVESRSETSVQDLNTFTVQLSEVNKTIHGIKNGKNSLNEVIKNISSINEKISLLSHKVEKLSAGLAAAPEIRQIPEKLQTVSKTVVDLGSEVTGMKDQVESFTQFMKTANTKLDGMTDKMNEIDMSSKTSDESNLSPDLANLIQSLPVQMGNLNASLLTQMSLLQSTLTEHEGRFVMLENTTTSLAKNLASLSHASTPAITSTGPADLRAQVAELVKDMLKKNTSNVDHDVNIDQNTMNQLLGNMDNLTTTVQGLKENYQKLLTSGTSTAGSGTENTEVGQLLSTFKDEQNHKLQFMNMSIVGLRHDLNHYAGIITQHSNQLVNVTHQISEIHRFIMVSPVFSPTSAANESKTTEGKEGTGVTKPGSSTVRPVTKTPGGNVKGSTTVEAPGVDKVTPQEEGTGSTTEPPAEGSMGGTKTPSPVDMSTANPDIVHVSRIHNMTELALNFGRWDLGGNGKVRYGDLPGYLGPEMPPVEQLQKFDANHDNVYSLQELAAAFGFNFDDLPADSPFRDQPPR